MATFTKQVAASSDDCTCDVDDDFMQALTNDWVGFPRDADATSNRESGLRFNNVTIPKDAIITSAKITGTAYSNYSNTINCKIYGEDANDASTFSTAVNFEGRTRTTAAVDWDTSADWVDGSDYDTADISTIIAEITSRAGWVSGNNLVIFIQNDGTAGSTRRNFRSYDYAGNVDGPVLTVEYSVGSVVSKNVSTMLYGVSSVSKLSRRKIIKTIHDMLLINANASTPEVETKRHHTRLSSETLNLISSVTLPETKKTYTKTVYDMLFFNINASTPIVQTTYLKTVNELLYCLNATYRKTQHHRIQSETLHLTEVIKRKTQHRRFQLESLNAVSSTVTTTKKVRFRLPVELLQYTSIASTKIAMVKRRSVSEVLYYVGDIYRKAQHRRLEHELIYTSSGINTKKIAKKARNVFETLNTSSSITKYSLLKRHIHPTEMLYISSQTTKYARLITLRFVVETLSFRQAITLKCNPWRYSRYPTEQIYFASNAWKTGPHRYSVIVTETLLFYDKLYNDRICMISCYLRTWYPNRITELEKIIYGNSIAKCIESKKT